MSAVSPETHGPGGVADLMKRFSAHAGAPSDAPAAQPVLPGIDMSQPISPVLLPDGRDRGGQAWTDADHEDQHLLPGRHRQRVVAARHVRKSGGHGTDAFADALDGLRQSAGHQEPATPETAQPDPDSAAEQPAADAAARVPAATRPTDAAPSGPEAPTAMPKNRIKSWLRRAAGVVLDSGQPGSVFTDELDKLRAASQGATPDTESLPAADAAPDSGTAQIAHTPQGAVVTPGVAEGRDTTTPAEPLPEGAPQGGEVPAAVRAATSRRLKGLSDRLVQAQTDPLTQEATVLYLGLLGVTRPDDGSTVRLSPEQIRNADMSVISLVGRLPGVIQTELDTVNDFEGTLRAIRLWMAGGRLAPTSQHNAHGQDLLDFTYGKGKDVVTYQMTRGQMMSLSYIVAQIIHGGTADLKSFRKADTLFRALRDEQECVDSGQHRLLRRMGEVAMIPADAAGTLATSVASRLHSNAYSIGQRWSVSRRGAVGSEREGGAAAVAVTAGVLAWAAYKLFSAGLAAKTGMSIDHGGGSPEGIASMAPTVQTGPAHSPDLPVAPSPRAAASADAMPTQTVVSRGGLIEHTGAPVSPTPSSASESLTPSSAASPSSTEATGPALSRRPDIPTGEAPGSARGRATTEYIVRPGDNVSAVASSVLSESGAPVTPRTIERVAASIAQESNLADPDTVRPGQKLQLANARHLAASLAGPDAMPSPRSAAGASVPPLADVQAIASAMAESPVPRGAGLMEYLQQLGVRPSIVAAAQTHPALEDLRTQLTTGPNPPLYLQDGELRISAPGPWDPGRAERIAHLLAQAADQQRRMLDED